LVFNIKLKLKIYSAASTGSRVKYMKYGSFPSLPVVAAQVLDSRAYYGLYITATLRQLFKYLVLTIGYLDGDNRKNGHVLFKKCCLLRRKLENLRLFIQCVSIELNSSIRPPKNGPLLYTNTILYRRYMFLRH